MTIHRKHYILLLLTLRLNKSTMYKPTEIKNIKTKVIEQVKEGVAIDKLSVSKDFPNKATLYKWLNTDADFLNEYTQAKEQDFKVKCLEMFDIIDDCKTDREAIMKAREQVQIRQWALARLLPKKWSLGAQNQTNIQVNLTPVTGMSILNELEEGEIAEPTKD